VRAKGLLVLVLTVGAMAAAPSPVRGHGVVAANHPAASQAGADVLALGGNAVDAVVAAALSAGVVQPSDSGLGGGGFALAVDGAGKSHFLDFREVAPAAATRDMYLKTDGTPDPGRSTLGGLAVAVPAESRGLAELLACCGTLSPRVVAGPAIRQASKGFEVRGHLAMLLRRAVKTDAVAGLFAIDGRPAAEGEVLARPELARTLAKWASSQGEDLAAGAGAAALAQAVKGAGGLVTPADLAAHHPKEREPLVGHYKGWTVITSPPPSSGGVILIEALQALESYDLTFGADPPGSALDSADYVHLVTEVMKHAYADRAHSLGDPDFVQIPLEHLLSRERTLEIRQAVVLDRTFPPSYYGSPIEVRADHGTQHISAIDAHGGAAALTTTINTAFGSQVVVPELGIPLNNEMDDFAAAPGVPNSYGLVGAESNAIAPGRHPLSSMAPTVLLDPSGKPVLSIGASGGSMIPSAVLEVILDVIEFHLDPEEAVSTPRFHHQWLPDDLVLEPGFPSDVVAALRARGHHVVVREQNSAVEAVQIDGDTVVGASDPRKDGRPAAVW
jgi:gamma-glutamyltranspeptidase/glutathione hydrolase